MEQLAFHATLLMPLGGSLATVLAYHGFAGWKSRPSHL